MGERLRDSLRNFRDMKWNQLHIRQEKIDELVKNFFIHRERGIGPDVSALPEVSTLYTIERMKDQEIVDG